MPEVVASYATQPNNFAKLRGIQQQIIRTYQLDFAKYAPAEQVAKIGEIFAQIPLQISKENQKFKVSGISKNARMREYSVALQWLVDTGMIHKVTNISHIAIPIAAHSDRDVFKLFLLDTGLLGALHGNPEPRTITRDATCQRDRRGPFANVRPSYFQILAPRGHWIAAIFPPLNRYPHQVFQEL